ncbi:hypothetical protein BCR34DRAFT_608292 [Clohesyomyces aquaticus]|uniref:Alpha/Beta hydrolase protein n=1 Tax=Clohesyomyces aquaticus TaxID=1231657 RepID=A0A1Y1Y8N8_9PLEO|nr:hypothetical protein BCR34DRAFT_608292 [Clohesyomyces aquaticus]
MLCWKFALGALITAVSATPLQSRSETNDTMACSFKDITPTPDLKYTPCYDDFTCANLEVPLDYENIEIGTTNIAFLRWNSPKQPVMGDIVFNPGGPGGSGVEFVLNAVNRLVPLLGDSYNIVGMDTRGVNNSGPNSDCFPGQPATRDYYQNTFLNVNPRSEDSVKRYYEESGGVGTWCSQALNDTANYINTPAIARDMLQYFELLYESQGKPREEALVNFYGASYGSALGTTFASLYPDRVGRFLIDAVVDVEDYYFGNWSQNLLQADESVVGMFTGCAEAGPKCPLYRNDSTPDNIIKRVDAVLQDLTDLPLAVTDPRFVQYPTVVTDFDLRIQIMIAAYNPPTSLAILAQMIADLENKNGSLLAVANGRGLVTPAECDNKSQEKEQNTPKWIIACNDNNKQWQVTEQSLFNLFAYNGNLSSWFGEYWTTAIVPQCRNLQFSPLESQVFKGFEKVKTRTPILFADNTLDPVSSSYDKMSAFFADSVILLQKGVGHGLIVTNSNCTSNYVQTYFQTGELPPLDTVCETDYDFFPEAAVGGALGKRALEPRPFSLGI